MTGGGGYVFTRRKGDGRETSGLARDPIVEEVRRINVKAGETVVFKLAHTPPASDRDRMLDAIRAALPEGVSVLLVDRGIDDISVIASEEAA